MAWGTSPGENSGCCRSGINQFYAQSTYFILIY